MSTDIHTHRHDTDRDIARQDLLSLKEQVNQMKQGKQQVERPEWWHTEDESCCSVCLESDGTNEDPIVYCDSCNTAVHAECYGYPLTISIPEGDWICMRCTNRALCPTATIPQCCLCPVQTGALKHTITGEWAHLSCAQWIPECFFRVSDGREGIDCTRIARRKFQQQCYYCDETMGVCIECAEGGCNRWFHITCGLRNGVFLEYNARVDTDVIVSYCDSHAKRWRGKKNGKAVRTK